MNTNAYELKYRCDSCDTLHTYRGSAEECCASVSSVYVCNECQHPFEGYKEFQEHVCGGKAAPEWVEGTQCLCGTLLTPEDYRPSMLLGAQVFCKTCRDKLLAGISTGEAVRQSFVERIV